ncbi:rRNA maturation RNase YbeY [Candidatus Chlamydia corallus]|uniref:rRNA maturation RNase YbeY n=1 Tax=Candidatus Chlamydia corallus TaxID=2038470 RepID=UPI003B835330
MQDKIKVHVSNEQTGISINLVSVEKLVLTLLSHLQVVTNEIFVYFLEDKALAKLHDEVFGDPYLTDTITLPIDAVGSAAYPHVLGEAFINPQAALRFLENTLPTHEEIYEEISRYLIHSILHMLGYNDSTSEEKRKMRVKENQILCMLRKKHALLTA